MEPHRYVVAQIGSRMHYAVPRIFAQRGMLERLYTDAYVNHKISAVASLVPRPLQPATLRRVLTRVPEGIGPTQITAFPDIGLRYLIRRRRATTSAQSTAASLWANREFGKRIALRGLGNASAVYAFNTAGLEVAAHARKRGIRAVIEQTMAPAMLERRILAEEQELFPDWEPSRQNDARRSEFERREFEEWQTADVILCGSAFVANGVRECGGPADRCRVVPYGVDARWRLTPRLSTRKPVRVLVAGAISLRKGSPYVLKAAQLLAGRAEFRMVGPAAVGNSAIGRLTKVVTIQGPAPVSDMIRHYEWADIFLLPSLCEGSATVCYEALSSGLPVITTANAGSIVRDQIDGYILATRDYEGIARQIELLANDDSLYSRMSSAAYEQSEAFSLEHYGNRLASALGHAQ